MAAPLGLAGSGEEPATIRGVPRSMTTGSPWSVPTSSASGPSAPMRTSRGWSNHSTSATSGASTTSVMVYFLSSEPESLTDEVEADRKSTRLNSSHTVIYTLSLHDALPIWLVEPFDVRDFGGFHYVSHGLLPVQ